MAKRIITLSGILHHKRCEVSSEFWSKIWALKRSFIWLPKQLIRYFTEFKTIFIQSSKGFLNKYPSSSKYNLITDSSKNGNLIKWEFFFLCKKFMMFSEERQLLFTCKMNEFHLINDLPLFFLSNSFYLKLRRNPSSNGCPNHRSN